MYPRLLRTSPEQFTAEVVAERKGYITVRIGKNPRALNLYWQLVDPTFSLLELGFEWPSGRLVHCSVPLFNGEVEEDRARGFPNAVPGAPFLICRSGRPMFLKAKETAATTSSNLDVSGC
jgi:hypothetical protein